MDSWWNNIFDGPLSNMKRQPTALYTRKPKMPLLMSALAVFVLYTNVCRCSKKYVFF